MKKVVFTLLALVGTMSMNAQVMKIMKGNTVVATYTAAQADNVVFEEESSEPTPNATTGTAKRTGDIDVNWVQLWENGPKFAEYNVGAANNKAEDYGGHYCWGKSIDKDSNREYQNGVEILTGTDDTATNLWGSNWRMLTRIEFQSLLDNCDVEWTTLNGINGRKYTGKGEYSSNSIFLPAAGYMTSQVWEQGSCANYWSSIPYDSESAFYLEFAPDDQHVGYDYKDCGMSVRAVLAE